MSRSENELQRYHTRRREAIALLGGKCIICGTTKKLQFDHINPEEKDFPVGTLWSIAKERYFSEIRKCQLLCEIHHKEKHKPLRQHGTYPMYRRGKCRCALCKEAGRQYMRDYRAGATFGS